MTEEEQRRRTDQTQRSERVRAWSSWRRTESKRRNRDVNSRARRGVERRRSSKGVESHREESQQRERGAKLKRSRDTSDTTSDARHSIYSTRTRPKPSHAPTTDATHVTSRSCVSSLMSL